MTAGAGGIAVHHVIDGPEGAPWITFSTGITNDTTMWDDHVDGLADRYRLLRYDSRGHGGSARRRRETIRSSCWSATSSACGTRSGSSARIWSASGSAA